MFTLLLLRHAKSDWSSHVPDIGRPLNERGRGDAKRMGLYLKQQGLIPDKMLVSVAQRAVETASLLVSQLPVTQSDMVFDKSLYLADKDMLCDNIAGYAENNPCLLVLAHNPGLDYLVNYLAATQPPLSAGGKLMTTCALARFQLDSVASLSRPGQARLNAIVRVKELTDSK